MGVCSVYNNVLIIYTDVQYIGKDICKRNQAEICRSDGVTNRKPKVGTYEAQPQFTFG